MVASDIDQSGQTVEGNQVNIAGDAKINQVGDIIYGDKVIIVLGETENPAIPFNPEIEPETVLIAAGLFLMGSPPGDGVPDYETPQHELLIPDFAIGRFPVTQANYERFLRANKSQRMPKDAGWFNRKPSKGRKDHPVAGVSWENAMAYCCWLAEVTGRRYNLPTEAQWEKAASWTPNGLMSARPQKQRYPWGDKWIEGRCNVSAEDTVAVSDCENGASAYGVQDLLGNVQEWTRSLWGSGMNEPEFTYPYDPQDGREVMTVDELPALMRIIHRGGSYRSEADSVNTTRRSHSAPNSHNTWRGFRVVLESG